MKLKNEHLDIKEFRGLVEALGGKVVGEVIQKRNAFSPYLYIGKGKLQFLKALAAEKGADTVVVYHNISSSQIRNIEKETGLTVRDRTEIILDIFSKRAKTKEAKIQVELAKYQHMLTKLRGKGKELSRLGGGIGTRGPGETVLESKSREIRKKIAFLKKEIERLSKKHSLFSASRKRKGLITGVVVGYTNVGKSTIVKALTKKDVFIKNIPFATLDTKTGSLYLKNIGKKVLISDTVGFIKDIPHELIASFKATLQEVLDADFLIKVFDISSENLREEISIVEKTLKEIGVENRPSILVFNKIDKLEEDPFLKIFETNLIEDKENIVFIFAKSGESLNKLIEKIESVVENLF